MKKIHFSMLFAMLCTLQVVAIGNDTLRLTWPDDFTNAKEYVGKIVELNQKLYVTDVRYWNVYGSISLSSERLISPTEIALPKSEEYFNILNKNASDKLTLDDGANTLFPNPLPWSENNDYIRNGAYTNHIIGKFSEERYGYSITPIESPKFENLERPIKPDTVGNYNIKVCGFNLQYYITSNFGTGPGPENERESQIQHNKLMKALVSINADIYGLVEVQQGSNAISKLTDALNKAMPNAKFSYINDGSSEYKTYTKSCFIYRSDKITPIQRLLSIDTEVPHRKNAQCFELNETGERFIFIINHFKAKSGKGQGDNADQGDGQGLFNGSRKREASATIAFAKSCANYYGENDVLIMGDLNAHSMEDPIRIITNAGYTNIIKKYEGKESYTYSFRGEVGCLDHALANPSMENQITGCDIFHINADESLAFGYNGALAKDDMYRSSDHDPVIVGIKLSKQTALENVKNDNKIIYGDNNMIGISNAENNYLSIYSITGQCVFNTFVDSFDYTINTGLIGLKSGIYLVQLQSKEDNSINTQKLIIR